MSKERKRWLDIVKGIAIILVVMGHVGSIYDGKSASRSSNAIHSSIWSFQIPLFMYLSCILGNEDTRRKNKRFILAVALICRIVWEVLTMQTGFTNNWVNDLIVKDFIKNYIWFALGADICSV